jgi:hypothetical protein
MENHLFEKHSYDMLEKLQIEYSDNEDRIQYAMGLIKKRSEAAVVLMTIIRTKVLLRLQRKMMSK